MKKFLITILLFLVPGSLFLLTGCGGNSDIKSKVVIGIDDEFAPMTFRAENGEIVGFDIDLAKEAARRLNIEIEFKPIDWNNKRMEITSRNIDMIWSGCDVMDEYKEYMIFGKPYMDNRQIVLVKKDSNLNIRSEYELEDKIVGTQAGSNSEDYVAQNAKLLNSLRDFKTYQSCINGFNALEGGEIDALIVDEIAGRYEITKNADKFKAMEVTIGDVTVFGVGFRKDNEELRDKVQKVFDEMIKDGTAQKISMQWFGADLIKSRR